MSAAPASRAQSSLRALHVSWSWKRFDALSGDDVYDALALRSEVFVVEQRCTFLDADGCDRDAWHLLARIDAQTDASSMRSGLLVAYLRCLDPGVKYAQPSIGRVTVASSYRRTGLGRALMYEGIARTNAQWPGLDILIAAQQRLEAFYVSLGFRVQGTPYLEDGIDHVEMRLATTRRAQAETAREQR